MITQLNLRAFILLFLLAAPAWAQKEISLNSPNGLIVFNLRVTKPGLGYRVTLGNSLLVNLSPLGLTFREGGAFGADLELPKPIFSEVNDTYILPVGKASLVHNHYRQAIIPLVERGKFKRRVNLIVRVFDDGVAFRYELPVQANWPAYTLTEENTAFNLVDNPTALTLFRPNYTTSHEGFYTRLPLNAIKNDTLMDLPTLFEYRDKTFLAITEAALRDYAGMYLMKHEGILRCCLSPLPGQTEVKVKASLPHQTPWRVLLISKRVGALIESNIITSLNDATQIKDLSWLKPGKTTFHWWNGDVTPDTTFSPGLNFETNQYYIDFCARNGLAYHTVIGYGGVAWYLNDGDSYQPGSHSDVTQPVASLDMQRICDYAKSKGVGIRVWTHWQPLYARLDQAFAQYEKWGISGLMVDFMDRDDQQMVNIQEEILQKAAAHHLHIQFHGAFKPTGLSRTYPNEFTREGTLNYENNKWGPPMSPDHDINMPFTRMLAGATDYHLGGFRAVPPERFKQQYTRPLMIGTRCHMLAMYVVLESYLGMVCDYPAAYEGQPGFEFIQEVPTTWDETRVPTAEVGQYICIARRKGTDWYLGVITNSKTRTLSVPLDFLAGSTYAAEIYTDAPDVAQNPNHLQKTTQVLHKRDTLRLNLAAGGGAAVVLKKRD